MSLAPAPRGGEDQVRQSATTEFRFGSRLMVARRRLAGTRALGDAAADHNPDHYNSIKRSGRRRRRKADRNRVHAALDVAANARMMTSAALRPHRRRAPSPTASVMSDATMVSPFGHTGQPVEATSAVGKAADTPAVRFIHSRAGGRLPAKQLSLARLLSDKVFSGFFGRSFWPAPSG